MWRNAGESASCHAECLTAGRRQTRETETAKFFLAPRNGECTGTSRSDSSSEKQTARIGNGLRKECCRTPERNVAETKYIELTFGKDASLRKCVYSQKLSPFTPSVTHHFGGGRRSDRLLLMPLSWVAMGSRRRERARMCIGTAGPYARPSGGCCRVGRLTPTCPAKCFA
jgi:hypothetical protein